MATINIKTEGSLLIASVTGDLTADEVTAVINEYYPTGTIRDVIWDLTNGTMQSISMEGFAAIAKASKETSERGARQKGKTVFVASNTTEHNMFCKYTALAEMAGIVVEFNVFKTVDGAINWIHGYWASQIKKTEKT
jgi:hypothetical protein